MAIYDQPARLLQTLIRFNTANPPGNEMDVSRADRGTEGAQRYGRPL